MYEFKCIFFPLIGERLRGGARLRGRRRDPVRDFIGAGDP